MPLHITWAPHTPLWNLLQMLTTYALLCEEWLIFWGLTSLLATCHGGKREGEAGSSLHVGEGQYAPRGCDPEHPNASLGGWGRDIQSIIALKDNCGWGDFGEGGVRSMSFIEVGPVHPFACTQLGVERRCNAPRHTDWGENKKKKKISIARQIYGTSKPMSWLRPSSNLCMALGSATLMFPWPSGS